MLVAGVLITAVFVSARSSPPGSRPTASPSPAPTAWSSRSSVTRARAHSFGTDRLFFDVLSRIIWGARTALEVVILSIFFCVVLGVPLGLVSGFYGGWLDRVLVLIMDALYAFPSFLPGHRVLVPAHRHLGGSVIAVALSLTVRLHPAVLPGGPQHHGQCQGGDATSRPPGRSGQATTS